MREIWVRRLGWLASVALVFFSAAALRVNAQSAPLPASAAQVEPQSAAEAPTVQVAGPPPSQFWLGVYSMPLDDALRSHLQLTAGQGLIVRDVIKDSPAAAAGVQVHDVLLMIGKRNLDAPQQLSEALDALGEQETEVALIRAGQRKSLKITPARRPTDAGSAAAGGMEENASEEAAVREFSQAFTGWVDKVGGQTKQRRIGFHVVRPGVIDVERLDVACCTKILPKDVKVIVSYEGDKSPAIEVCRGVDRWRATVDNLDAIPVDLRMYAWQITQPSVMYVPREKFPGTVEIQIPAEATGQSAAPGGGQTLLVQPEPSTQPPAAGEVGLKQQLEQLAAEIAKLRAAVDKLSAGGQKSGE